MKVSSIIDEEGQWDLNPIQHLLTQQDKANILSIYRSKFVTFMDTPSWQGTPNGNFSSSVAYNALTK